jgi:hypothetical protein
MERKDWTLLTVAAAEGAPLDPAQLQKCLFLLGRECPQATAGAFYRFQPYHYGPFDRAIYWDAEALEAEGLLTITGSESLRTYAATPLGLSRAAEIRSRVPVAANYLAEVVKWARRLSFADLVRAIYMRYPEMAANTAFRG